MMPASTSPEPAVASQRRAVGVDRGAAVRRGDHRVGALVDTIALASAAACARPVELRQALVGRRVRETAARTRPHAASARLPARRAHARRRRTLPAARERTVSASASKTMPCDESGAAAISSSAKSPTFCVRAEPRPEDQRAGLRSARIPRPPPSVSALRRMIEVRCAALTCSALAGDSTSPPLPRRAPRPSPKAARRRSRPARRKTRRHGRAHICACRRPAAETRRATSAGVFSKQLAADRLEHVVGMPMSATIVSPQCAGPDKADGRASCGRR